ncbi:MAG: hypothetical protein P4N60_18440 [Verrucomicrobiae bacterium]|nr:hypothetical protein [Verrucomicrobiae bacterium]
MPPNPTPPPANDQPGAGSPPPTLPATGRQAGGLRQLVAVLLSLFAGLFMVDGILSLADDSLILGWGAHLLSVFRGVSSFLVLFLSAGLYGLMGLTPLIPKRWFLPLVLFTPASFLVVIPAAIYGYERMQLVGWLISVGQVVLGLVIVRGLLGGFKFRWPLVAGERLGGRNFSWRNLWVFVGVNVFGVLPLVVGGLFLSAALAVDHFSEGFMALHPGGFTVQVRKYVRSDGKTIELFPMSHVADAGFYQKVSETFPTNSIILMEGVTDEHNLLTNKISYKRMAKSLGLSEQKEEFVPRRGERVRADVDVDVFSAETLKLLNLVMRFHAAGVSPEMVQEVMQYSPPPHFEDRLLEDLVTKRNQHLLAEIQSHLPESDNIMVPWGVAHMPGIAREIQKTGFHLEGTREYVVIRFGGGERRARDAGK